MSSRRRASATWRGRSQRPTAPRMVRGSSASGLPAAARGWRRSSRSKICASSTSWALWHAGERGRSDDLQSDPLLERCRAAFGSKAGRPSRMQRHVGVALASLGLCPEEEVVLHEGYSLDFVVEWRGERVGVEVDGPSHFKGREPNSAMLLKRRPNEPQPRGCR